MTSAKQVHRYEPRGVARTLFSTRMSEVAISGPAGTGKSLACLFRLHFAALKRPGIRCLIVRKTAVSLGSTTLVTFERQVAAEALAQGVVRWFGGSTREAASYRYANGSTIVVGGMDKPEKVLSSEFDLIFADEATELTETDWEVLGTRLRHGALPWQQQIAACNPAHPTHWIKRRAEGPLRMLHSRHRDNPAYYRADGVLTSAGRDYMAKLDALTGVRRLRLRDGVWAAAEGIIYEEFDESIHVIDRFDIPASWPRYWVVDFGFVHPMVIQSWASDEDGRLYMYREVFRTATLVEDHAARMLGAVTDGNGAWTEPRPTAIICDHDAESRAVLDRHLGIATTAAKKTVTDGIQAVQSRLRPSGDGRPRLFFLRDSLMELDQSLAEAGRPVKTVDEFASYVWDPKKEAPVKENDDGMDTTRYMVAHLDLQESREVHAVGGFGW